MESLTTLLLTWIVLAILGLLTVVSSIFGILFFIVLAIRSSKIWWQYLLCVAIPLGSLVLFSTVFVKGCGSSNLESICRLDSGFCYRSGKSALKSNNIPKAREIFEFGCKANDHSMSCFELARIEVKANPQKARRLFELGCNRRPSSDNCLELAKMEIQSGESDEGNIRIIQACRGSTKCSAKVSKSELTRLRKLLCLRGDTIACNNAGVDELGNDNPLEAQKYLEKCCDENYRDSCCGFLAGAEYRLGNVVKAYNIYRAKCESGNKAYCKRQLELKCELERRLQTSQNSEVTGINHSDKENCKVFNEVLSSNNCVKQRSLHGAVIRGYYEDGNLIGVELLNLNPMSILYSRGFRSNDIIFKLFGTRLIDASYQEISDRLNQARSSCKAIIRRTNIDLELYCDGSLQINLLSDKDIQ